MESEFPSEDFLFSVWVVLVDVFQLPVQYEERSVA